MTLLLEGLVVALVGIFELVGLVALARYTEATRETNPPAQANSTLVASEDARDYWWVKWEGSCSVWEIQKVGERRVNSFEYEAGIGEGENCRVVHIRPHIASTGSRALGLPVGIEQSLLPRTQLLRGWVNKAANFREKESLLKRSALS